jgi:hypothetical protein
MSTKLNQENPELATLLAGLDDTALQKTALRAAKAAIATTGADAPLVAQIIEQTPIPFGDTEVRTQLDELADQIEGPYLDALDKGEDVENNPELMKRFQQARAITSLWFALSDNPQMDAADAMYEALHAGVKPEAIKQFLA